MNNNSVLKFRVDSLEQEVCNLFQINKNLQIEVYPIKKFFKAIMLRESVDYFIKILHNTHNTFIYQTYNNNHISFTSFLEKYKVKEIDLNEIYSYLIRIKNSSNQIINNPNEDYNIDEFLNEAFIYREISSEKKFNDNLKNINNFLKILNGPFIDISLKKDLTAAKYVDNRLSISD